MSQNHLNYINGVPVKISEKYKPPIKIQMNQNLSHRLANVDNEISQLLASNYDFSLEKNVLNKLSEWERVRQQQNCDRKERIRGRQQEQQRHIEQKQKQMLTSVSYPSTDDLSSDDDRESSNDSTTIKQSSTDSETTTNAVILKSGHFSPANCFDNILIPTVIPEQLLNNRTSNILAPKFNKINYSDFENDTSSPFDNVELKTMNDLDILAQVLNINTKISDENKSVKGNQTNQSADINQKQTNVTVNTPSRMNASDYQSIYHTQQQNCSVQSPLANSYYDQSRFVNSNQPQMNQNAYNYVSQSYSNDQHTSPGKGLSYQLTEYSNIINSLKSSKNEYYNGFNGRKETCNPQQLYQNNFVNNRNYYSQGPNKLAFHTQQPEIPNISKSKSVPDIVQELNNDLKNSERKRTRNNSQSSVNTANGNVINFESYHK